LRDCGSLKGGLVASSVTIELHPLLIVTVDDFGTSVTSGEELISIPLEDPFPLDF